jgi:hypothetical protein
VIVWLPPFWAERPAVWFAQAEEQFFLAGISSETATFYYVISQLDHRYATEVEEIITSPPERDPYTTLRTELVRRLSLSREQRIPQLLTLEEMGDRKPSQFLRHLRSLAPDVSDDLIRSIWSSHIPANIQAILGGKTEGNLKAAARCADRIYEVASQPALASVDPNLEQAISTHRTYSSALDKRSPQQQLNLQEQRSNSTHICQHTHRRPLTLPAHAPSSASQLATERYQKKAASQLARLTAILQVLTGITSPQSSGCHKEDAAGQTALLRATTSGILRVRSLDIVTFQQFVTVAVSVNIDIPQE